MGILDFLFPKYCVNCKRLGSYLCSDCFSFISFDVASTCLVCTRASIDGLTHPKCRGRYTIDGTFASIVYKGVVKKLLYTFKYKPHLLDLQAVLIDLFYEGLIQNEEFYRVYQNHRSNLVPIPLHTSKSRTRGYNQAEVLAKGLAQKFNIEVHNLLKRTKPTRSQVGLDRKKRKENISGAFSVAPNILISKYLNIFLVDDVLTSGSTLLEAAWVLKRSGVRRVWGLALAQD